MNHRQHPESPSVDANPSSQTVARVVNAPATNIINDPLDQSFSSHRTATITNAMGGLYNKNNNDGNRTNTKRLRREDGDALTLGLEAEEQPPNYLSVVVQQGSSGTGTGMESSPSGRTASTNNDFLNTDHDGGDDVGQTEFNALYQQEMFAFSQACQRIYKAGQQSKEKEHADVLKVMHEAHRQVVMQLSHKIIKLKEAMQEKDDEIKKATQAFKQKDQHQRLLIMKLEEYISAYEEVRQVSERECNNRNTSQE